MTVAQIVSITGTPADVERRPADRYARVAVERATLQQGRGIEGDVKSRGGDRQLNVMRAETVAELREEGFRVAPGELGEQLVIAGLDADVLAVGGRLRLGASAVLEVTAPRTPCSRFAHIQGKSIEAARGRIGVMARVVQGGDIAVGGAVAVEEASATRPGG